MRVFHSQRTQAFPRPRLFLVSIVSIALVFSDVSFALLWADDCADVSRSLSQGGIPPVPPTHPPSDRNDKGPNAKGRLETASRDASPSRSVYPKDGASAEISDAARMWNSLDRLGFSKSKQLPTSEEVVLKFISEMKEAQKESDATSFEDRNNAHTRINELQEHYEALSKLPHYSDLRSGAFKTQIEHAGVFLTKLKFE